MTVGCVAGDEESYDVFADLLDPVIDKRHGGYSKVHMYMYTHIVIYIHVKVHTCTCTYVVQKMYTSTVCPYTILCCRIICYCCEIYIIYVLAHNIMYM